MAVERKFKTLVIVDLETTGLICDQPKIIELAMIVVNM
jgi:oligoribonuclease (3'-5' exoribonuclease)